MLKLSKTPPPEIISKLVKETGFSQLILEEMKRIKSLISDITPTPPSKEIPEVIQERHSNPDQAARKHSRYFDLVNFVAKLNQKSIQDIKQREQCTQDIKQGELTTGQLLDKALWEGTESLTLKDVTRLLVFFDSQDQPEE